MPAKIEGPTYRDIFTLHVWRRRGEHNIELALNDGTWFSQDSMMSTPENSGILIPGDVFDDVFQAFLTYKGFKEHTPTEVKVLREWLAHERARVDDMVEKFLK